MDVNYNFIAKLFLGRCEKRKFQFQFSSMFFMQCSRRNITYLATHSKETILRKNFEFFRQKICFYPFCNRRLNGKVNSCHNTLPYFSKLLINIKRKVFDKFYRQIAKKSRWV